MSSHPVGTAVQRCHGPNRPFHPTRPNLNRQLDQDLPSNFSHEMTLECQKLWEIAILHPPQQPFLREPSTHSMISRTNTCNTARFKPPFARDDTKARTMSVHVAVLWSISCLTHTPWEGNRKRKQTRFRVKTIPEVNQNLHDFKCFWDKSHKIGDVQIVWFQVHKSLDLQTLKIN